MLKKQISLLISLLLILLSVSSIAYAADDAAGLKYNAKILVYNSANEEITTANCGDAIRVDVVLENAGVATAPLYALQGRLAYESNYLLYDSGKNIENIKMSKGNDIISFSFLDETVNGVEVSYPYTIASMTFVVLQDATTKLMLNQFDVTNKDASERNVDYSSLKELKLGTGIRTEDKPALMRLITVCQNELNKVIISANADDVSINTLWVTQATYDKYKASIKAVLDVYESATAEKDDISNAFKSLITAADEFRANKSYGIKDSGMSGGGNVKKKTVTVTATADEHGKISDQSLKQIIITNTSVTIISIPDEGYEVDKIYVNGEEFKGSDKFTIPKVTNDTVVKVTFCWKNVFADVKADDWFYASVMFAHKNGLMKGTGETNFDPNVSVTRGMFVTVLYRMEKEPTVEFSDFEDVKSDEYFAKAVGWAKNNNIVNGISSTQFAPNENVTREQMATIIYKYALFKGIDEMENKATYADSANISDYAIKAVDFCTAKEIMKGNIDNTFAPKSNATRAEISAVLQRIMEKF